MDFSLAFISLYLVSLLIGKVTGLRPGRVVDATVVGLIFSISLWGGATIISATTLINVVGISLLLALVVVLVTYVVGLAIPGKVHPRGHGRILDAQLKYGLPLLLGLLVGYLMRPQIPFDSLVNYELYFLAVVVGINMGSDLKLRMLVTLSKGALFSILVVIGGGVISALISSALGLLPSLRLSLVVMLGSGWYSYTGPLVSSYYGPIYGLVGFLANFFREQLTFLMIPPLFKAKPNPYSAIAVGGATSMDTTLGLYSTFLGAEYSVSAMMSGVVLTLLVPVLLPLILVGPGL